MTENEIIAATAVIIMGFAALVMMGYFITTSLREQD